MKRRVKRHAVVQPQDQSIRLIPLTKGYNAMVDADDFDWLMERAWMVQNHGTVDYSVNSDGQLMHRVIMARYFNIEGTDIDHKDCDGLNNRRSNLRVASKSQNGQNRRLGPHNKSGFKGVRFMPNRNFSYRSEIKVNGKPITLGYFKTAEEAHLKYKQAAFEYFGEFARPR